MNATRRGDLREQFKTLASHRGLPNCEARNIPARAVEPCDEAAADGIGHTRSDRDRPRLPLDARNRAADAARLVPPGSLLVDRRTGDARAAYCAQAGAGKTS